MKLTYLLFALQAFHLYTICVTQSCTELNEKEDRIYEYTSPSSSGIRCWTIIAEDMFVNFDISGISFKDLNCSSTYVQIDVLGSNETFTLCYSDDTPKTILALDGINITFVHDGGFKTTIFNFKYIKEQRILAIKGVNETRKNVMDRLWKQRSSYYIWGSNTPRGITALYLARNTDFFGKTIEEEVSVKQLQLQALIAIMRNPSTSVTVGDLSMFINALLVTCHDPRHFNGHNFLQQLSDRLAGSKIPNPGAYLTLCNANWTFSESSIRDLTNVLYKQFENAIHLDIQAMTVMALACVNTNNKSFDIIQEAVYKTTIRQFIDNQRPDGSFGNVYTTALVTQALLASGQESNDRWKLNSTMKFMMQNKNSFTDFLSTYLILPTLNGKSLADLQNVKCTNYRRIVDNENMDDKNKLNRINIQYSLHVGNQKDTIHTLDLSIKSNSSAYDVMRMAEVIDNTRYGFLHSEEFGNVFVYGIGGIINDSEKGNFWFLYIENSSKNIPLRKQSESLTKIIVENGDHLIMWYKNVHG